MPEPKLAAVPDAHVDGPNSHEQALLTARCPECEFREGPFTNQAAARDALLRHINAKHGALIAYLRAKPLPSANEGFAASTVSQLMQQAIRLDQAMQPKAILTAQTPPIDAGAEVLLHIRGVNKAVASILDILLEMRTGQCVMQLQRNPKVPADQTEAGDEPAKG